MPARDRAAALAIDPHLVDCARHIGPEESYLAAIAGFAR
ncbi:hypothetical protein FHY05_003268 [Sphingomonas sp. BK580]|nr:hypothetical protein [Sphingomonas sp. BK580]